MRYVLSLLCLATSSLTAAQSAGTPEAPAKENYMLPGENDQFENDDVVDQPDYNPPRAHEPSGIEPKDMKIDPKDMKHMPR